MSEADDGLSSQLRNAAPWLGQHAIRAANEIDRLRTQLAAAEAQLSRCGKENCVGHDAGEHVARWVRAERLEAAEAKLQAMRKALEDDFAKYPSGTVGSFLVSETLRSLTEGETK